MANSNTFLVVFILSITIVAHTALVLYEQKLRQSRLGIENQTGNLENNIETIVCNEIDYSHIEYAIRICMGVNSPEEFVSLASDRNTVNRCVSNYKELACRSRTTLPHLLTLGKL